MNIDKSDAAGGRPASSVSAELTRARSSDAADGSRTPNAGAAPSSAPVTLSPGLQAIIDNSRTSLASEVDSQRVEGIRQAISDGTYHVDPDRLAAQFIELESLIDQ
ncbi:MAG: flagellar biosynthesis anti-sigma factor FlgM [Pseudomonadales bacterium]